MLKKLFSSEVRVLLLNHFLMHPQKEFYLRELSGKFNLSPRSVSLELKNLESIELLRKKVSGKQHYYSVNRNHPLFHDLQNIFLKTIGIKDVIREKLEIFIHKINFAFIYGSVAKGTFTSQSDVDLMIIGNVSSRKLSSVLLKAGEIIVREINYSVMKYEELINRIKNKDHFVITLIREPKIFIFGDSIEFDRLGEKWLVDKA